MSSMKPWQAYSIFFLIAMCWGLGFPLTKEGLMHVGPASFMFSRFLVATLILIALRPKQSFSIKKSEWIVGAALGFFLALGFVVQTIGLEVTSSGKAGFITSLNILIVPIISSLLFGRRIIIKDRIAIGLAVLGFFIMSMHSLESGIAPGDLWILACAFFFAFQIVGIEEWTKNLRVFQVNMAQVITSTVICGAVAVLREDTSVVEYQAAAMPIVLTAVLSLAFPLLAQMYAQRVVSATSAALIMSLEAVFAVLFGWWLHSEILSEREFLGCFIILAATILLLSPTKLLMLHRLLRKKI